MEFNQLESFISVVKNNSFSLAAKELYTTQPTVSNNIKNLEKELNTTLLDRTSKIITLTDSGKLFYKYAVELINIRDKAKFSISEHDCRVEGEIEICASSIPEEYILPYIIKDFLKIYPKVSFSITHKNSKDVIDNILGGKLNYGIVGAKYYSESLEYIDYIITEINRDTLYKNCVQENELDLFLSNFAFVRVETFWAGGTWGDALYIKQ